MRSIGLVLAGTSGRQATVVLAGSVKTTCRRFLDTVLFSRVLLSMALLSFLVLSGCQPKLVLEQPSPNGAFVARVLDRPVFDGPANSLWLFERGSRKAIVERHLGEDSDWCNQIVWSSDSRWVGFLVQDAWVFAYLLGEELQPYFVELVERDGYPTTHAVRKVKIGNDGEVVYQVCPRGSSDISLCREETRLITGMDPIQDSEPII